MTTSMMKWVTVVTTLKIAEKVDPTHTSIVINEHDIVAMT